MGSSQWAVGKTFYISAQVGAPFKLFVWERGSGVICSVKSPFLTQGVGSSVPAGSPHSEEPAGGQAPDQAGRGAHRGHEQGAAGDAVSL